MTWAKKLVSNLTEVKVKGCHSNCETLGQWRNMYCPDCILKSFFFICNSKTLDGCFTTWKINVKYKKLPAKVWTNFGRMFLKLGILFYINPYLGNHHSLLTSIKSNTPFAEVKKHWANNPHPSLENYKIGSVGDVFEVPKCLLLD